MYRGMLEHLFECLHFRPELADDLGVGVLVDDGVVHDLLGAVGVPQGRQGLLEVVAGGGDGGDHHRPTVAAQVVLRSEDG
jgi:hypothetical protein